MSRDNLDELNQGLLLSTRIEVGSDHGGASTQANPHEPVSKFTYTVTKIFPLLATGLFASVTDVKKPESIALSSSMVLSALLPITADLLKKYCAITDKSVLRFEIAASTFMSAGVGMMDWDAVKADNKSLRAYLSLSAVGFFSLFSLVNTVYSVLKLADYVKKDKPLVEFLASSSGLVGSILFLVVNSLKYHAQHQSGQTADESLRVMIVAALFTLSTAYHAKLAATKLCAKKELGFHHRVDGASLRDAQKVDPQIDSPVDDRSEITLCTQSAFKNGVGASSLFPPSATSFDGYVPQDVPGANSPVCVKLGHVRADDSSSSAENDSDEPSVERDDKGQRAIVTVYSTVSGLDSSDDDLSASNSLFRRAVVDRKSVGDNINPPAVVPLFGDLESSASVVSSASSDM